MASLLRFWICRAALEAFPGADGWKMAAFAGASPGRRCSDPIDAPRPHAAARALATQGGRSRWSSTSSCCARSPRATSTCSTCTAE
jgi:hypothetical protein